RHHADAQPFGAKMQNQHMVLQHMIDKSLAAVFEHHQSVRVGGVQPLNLDDELIDAHDLADLVALLYQALEVLSRRRRRCRAHSLASCETVALASATST